MSVQQSGFVFASKPENGDDKRVDMLQKKYKTCPQGGLVQYHDVVMKRLDSFDKEEDTNNRGSESKDTQQFHQELIEDAQLDRFPVLYHRLKRAREVPKKEESQEGKGIMSREEDVNSKEQAEARVIPSIMKTEGCKTGSKNPNTRTYIPLHSTSLENLKQLGYSSNKKDAYSLSKQDFNPKQREIQSNISKSLFVELQFHQQQGIVWMLGREQDVTDLHCRGGMLADACGQGKTLQAVSCILYNKQKTLIIAPKIVATQWVEEISKYTGDLCVKVYHGTQKNQSADVIITTYGTLRSEYKSGGALQKEEWYRVICDEGDTLRNHNTQQYEACLLLKRQVTWILTATPLHNELEDIYSMFGLLQYGPYTSLLWKQVFEPVKPCMYVSESEYAIYSNATEEPVWMLAQKGKADPIEGGKDRGKRRIEAMLRQIMLRREKADLTTNNSNATMLIRSESPKNLDIPKPMYITHCIQPSAFERTMLAKLQQMTLAHKQQVDIYPSGGTSILPWLQLYQRACTSIVNLPPRILDVQLKDQPRAYISCPLHTEKTQEEELHALLGNLRLDGKKKTCVCGLQAPDIMQERAHLDSNTSSQSSKLAYLLLLLQCIAEYEPHCSILIFSHWTTNLNHIEHAQQNWECEYTPVDTKPSSFKAYMQDKKLQAYCSMKDPDNLTESQADRMLETLTSRESREHLVPHNARGAKTAHKGVECLYRVDGSLTKEQVHNNMHKFKQGYSHLSKRDCPEDSNDLNTLFENLSISKQTHRIPLNILLISTNMGSSGLNLVEASHVIHFDPLWNPAQRTQASGRALRLGQTKMVRIHDLYLNNTVDLRVYGVRRQKKALATQIVEGKTDASEKLSNLDMRKLFE